MRQNEQWVSVEWHPKMRSHYNKAPTVYYGRLFKGAICEHFSLKLKKMYVNLATECEETSVLMTCQRLLSSALQRYLPTLA